MKKLSALLSSLGIFLFYTVPAFAQNPVETIQLQNTQTQGITPGTCVNAVLKGAFTLVFTIASIIVLAILIWGAISWVLSAGDKDKVAAARKKIIDALIGMAVLALTFFILRLVGNIVGFDILGGLTIPTLGTPIHPQSSSGC